MHIDILNRTHIHIWKKNRLKHFAKKKLKIFLSG